MDGGWISQDKNKLYPQLKLEVGLETELGKNDRRKSRLSMLGFLPEDLQSSGVSILRTISYLYQLMSANQY